MLAPKKSSYLQSTLARARFHPAVIANSPQWNADQVAKKKESCTRGLLNAIVPATLPVLTRSKRAAERPRVTNSARTANAKMDPSKNDIVADARGVFGIRPLCKSSPVG
jgi:hypothetical protein